MIDLSASLSARMQQAFQRSRSKVSVDAVLRVLPVEERQAILVDLLASYESEATSKPSAGSRSAVAAAPTKAAVEPGTPPIGLPAGGATEHTSLSERLLDILRETPGTSIEHLSQTLYGRADNASRNRVSTTLTHLKRRGKVQLVRRGTWRVVEPRRGARAERPVKLQATLAEPAADAKAERPTRPQSAADRVRGLLREHPEGLTTGQIRDLLGPLQPRDKIGTIVAKMSGRGIVVASGKKGSSIYTLTERAAEDPSANTDH